uniref:Uncharacterized protein n=1 Tax=Arundo donax TaxID=35708 RepID=A0A0A8Y3B5_ARUDO
MEEDPGVGHGAVDGNRGVSDIDATTKGGLGGGDGRCTPPSSRPPTDPPPARPPPWITPSSTSTHRPGARLPLIRRRRVQRVAGLPCCGGRGRWRSERPRRSCRWGRTPRREGWCTSAHSQWCHRRSRGLPGSQRPGCTRRPRSTAPRRPACRRRSSEDSRALWPPSATSSPSVTAR